MIDRPEAEASARATFAAAGIGDRADFFAAVPDGHELYVLTAIVHDWSDTDVVRILRRCVEVLPPGRRILVVEQVLDPGYRGSFAQLADILMLACTKGGRERTAAQFADLWKRAELRCTRDTILASLSHVFELQAR